jgi:ethanolamine utilization protein EutA
LIESILSVGIDIGTSTTELVFSIIKIENTASFASVPRISIVDKEVIYKSDIYLTPLISQAEIDGLKLRDIVQMEYKRAGIRPSEISTGVAIITGETARKRNASQVMETLSGLAGDFVVTTAGPDLEGIIAGKGAGAHVISKETGKTVANLDIGGGTTNIAVFKGGEVIDTCCLDIGGRLIRFRDDGMKVQYIAPKLKQLCTETGVDIVQNREASKQQLKLITNRMAGILEEVLGIAAKSPALAYMVTAQDLRRDYSIDCVSFSGGVADCIYRSADNGVFRFGDIGMLLGEAIRKSSIFERFEILVPAETIRATVIGAGTHTVDISGSTINYTRDIFPVKNIPILKVSAKDEDNDYEMIAESIKEKLRWFHLEGEEQQVALAIKGVKNPSFSRVCKIAAEVLKGLEELLKTKLPIIVIIENDMAKALGQTIYSLLGYNRDVICIDNIKVENGDYIDIGKPLSGGRVVPVIIKTLVFNS